MEIENNTSYSFWERTSHFSFVKRLLYPKKVEKSLKTPSIITEECEGLLLNNQLIKSILFSTDLALIENNDCDAILAVYPFSPSKRIMESIINFSSKPVICGVGGARTQGRTSVEMSVFAEKHGASAVIVNQPFKAKDIAKIKQKINIPIISSVTNLQCDFEKRIDAGVSIFNVTGGSQTLTIVKHIRQHFPHIPIICTGGKSLQDITRVIENKVKAVILTPPSNATMFKKAMENYRKGIVKFKNYF